MLFCVCLSLYIWITLPVLNGGFVLDDFPNLYGLSSVTDVPSLIAYSLDGVSSQLGRPLSYLSFGLQFKSWPENPAPFKIVNMGIHIVNAIIVYLVCRRFSFLFEGRKESSIVFAVCVAVIWLILPIHASTVFYVVQRMTLLSAMFTLLSLLVILESFRLHQKFPESRLPYIFAFGGMGAGYFFGVLSKENAILLGGYASLVFVFFSRHQKGTFNNIAWRTWLWTTCYLPLMLLIVYFSWGGKVLEGYAQRDFTLIERLLTESVILWDYARKIVFPTPSGLNIFNESFPIAKGIFTYPYPVFAIFGWCSVLIISYKFRHSCPFLLFGVIWFLYGHSLESSFIGLELYFEHRNYLPSLGLICLVVAAFLNLWRGSGSSKNSGALRALLAVLSLAGLCSMIFTLRAEVKSWQSQKDFVEAAIFDRPHALRAWQEAASYYVNSGDVITSAGVLHHIDKEWPDFPGTTANQMLLKCLDENVKIPEFQYVLDRFETGLRDRSVIPALKHILDLKDQGECKYLSWQDFRALVESLIRNSRNNIHYQNAIILISFSHVAEENYLAAAVALDRFRGGKDMQYQIMQAQFYVMGGEYDDALGVLEAAEISVEKNIKERLAFAKRIRKLKLAVLEKTETSEISRDMDEQ